MHTSSMSLKRRRASHRPLLPTRSSIQNCLFGFRYWKAALLLVVAIHGVGGTTNDDYYSYINDDVDPEEAERVHEVLVDDWYDLIRYLVALCMCIFSLIGLYFHQFASYDFLRKYTRPRETEQRIGRVLSCKPVLSSTSIPGEKAKSKKRKKKKKKKEKLHQGTPVSTFRREAATEDVYTNATDYVREEDLEWQQQHYHQSQLEYGEVEGEFTGYRMLVVYKVPKPRSASLLCCGPTEKRLPTIDWANSFATCGSGISDTSSTLEAIETYRSQSLPLPFKGNTMYNDFNEQLSMDYMNMNDEYFQWFETETPKPIDSKIDLILLKGRPTSACTPELLKRHLAEVGKAHDDDEKHRCCKSISVMGTVLVVAVLILSLVCFFEIQAMPNPETQRPIGYTVLGGFFAGSTVSAYLFAKLLFEQYKQKVFLSAFMAPSGGQVSVAARSSSSTSVSTNDSILQPQEQHEHAVIIP